MVLHFSYIPLVGQRYHPECCSQSREDTAECEVLATVVVTLLTY
jgi:hypothetical protein